MKYKSLLRRFLIGSLVPMACGLLGLQTAHAEDYPTRPIRLIVPFAAGGGVDFNARVVANKLAEYLGQPIIVENKPGAGTNIANDYVAKAPPDGYTLLINSAAIAINMSLYKKLPFDTLRDFSPISFVSTSPNVLVVNPKMPVGSVRDLVKLAKQKPGAINYASAGNGSTQHLVAELFKTQTDTDMLHVPYNGTGPLLTSLLAGDVDLTFANIAPISAYVKAGKLKALATTGSRRSPLMPELPTMKEAGVDGLEVDVWVGIFAPAKTPPAVVQRLAAAITKATASPEVRKAFTEQGNDAVSNTPEEFKKFMKTEVAKWREVIKTSGATAD